MADSSLTGGSIPQQPSFASRDILKSIDSVLRAIAGPHREYADQLSRGEIPKIPSNFAEGLGFSPFSVGGVRSPRQSSSNLSGRQLRTINEVEDWLNQSGIDYSINMNRSNSNSVYVYARHPSTGENIAIRVPRDGHIGYVDQRAQAKYKDTNRPGNFYDTGHVVSNTNRPLQPEYLGNVSGEPFHDMGALRDALAHRFSRSPSGQFLVSPGREPHYPSERLSPIPMTNPPVAYGTGGVVRTNPPPNFLNGPPRQQGGRIVLPPRRPRQMGFEF